MQQVPCRLSQTIWSAFKAARPVCRTRAHFPQPRQAPLPSWTRPARPSSLQTRFYSDSRSMTGIDAESGRTKLGEAASELNARPTGTEAERTVIHIPPSDDSSTVHTNPPNDSVSTVTAATTTTTTAAAASPSRSSSTSPLPSERSAAPASLQARFASYMDNVQSYVFTASQRLNDLTGYSSIQSLKDSIAAQETEVADARGAVKANRARYAEAIKTRSEIQREVNDLLHRKHSWTPEDVEKFTRLYRSDHANEQAEQSAQHAVASAEQAYEEASTRLGRLILARYHEEQIWSDKIRQMSTWGTWGLMGINILLFIILQVLLEPWRRRRLVRGFEEKVEAALQQREREGLLMKEGTEAVAEAPEVAPLASSSSSSSLSLSSTTTTSPSPSTSLATETEGGVAGQPLASTTAAPNVSLTKSDPKDTASEQIVPPPPRASNPFQSIVAVATAAYAHSEAAVHSLFSEQPLVVSQRALTTLALEAAAAGAVVTGLVVLLIKPR